MELRVVPPVLDAEPRQLVHVRLELENASGVERTLTPRVSVARDWRVLVPPGEITLLPGETRLEVFSIFVAPNATAGSYTFPITYFLSRDAPVEEVRFTIRVVEVHRVAVAPVESPAYVVAEPFTARFLVSNHGNVQHDVLLDAQSSHAFPVTLDEHVVTLDAGETREVIVRVAAPEDIAEEQNHVLTLRAQHAALPEVGAVARTTTRVIPRHLPGASAYHTFPLSVRFSTKVGVRGSDGTPVGIVPTIGINGVGAFSDRDPGRLGVRFIASFESHVDIEHASVAYERDGFTVALGDGSFRPSPLLPAEDGFGLSTTARWDVTPGFSLSGTVEANLTGGSPAVGIASEGTLAHGASFWTSLHVSKAGLLPTLSVKYATLVADPTLVQLDLAQLTYGARIRWNDDRVGHAAHFGVRLRQGTSIASVDYRVANAKYGHSEEHHAALKLMSVLRLNEAFYIDPAYPVHLHFAYEGAWLWPGSDAFAFTPPVIASEDTRTFGVTLDVRIADVALSLGHRYHDERRLGLLTQERMVSARAQVRLADSGVLTQEANWARESTAGAASDAIGYEAEVSLPTGDAGRLGARFQTGYSLTRGALEQLSFGVQWDSHIGASFELRARSDVYILGTSELWRLETAGSYFFPNTHVLDFELQARGHREHSIDVTFAVGYAVPLSIPLGRRSGFGELTGAFLDESGGPVRGLIVSVAGQLSVTQSDGTFLFPAVPEGDHLLNILPSELLAPSHIISPSVPHPVTVSDGQTERVSFRVLEGATITGRLVVSEPNQERESLLVRPNAGGSLVGGVLIELQSGSSTLHVTTDAAGAFEFHRLLPGEWTLRVQHPQLPPNYLIEPRELRISLASGESETVRVELIPDTRRIQFDEGGVLESTQGD